MHSSPCSGVCFTSRVLTFDHDGMMLMLIGLFLQSAGDAITVFSVLSSQFLTFDHGGMMLVFILAE